MILLQFQVINKVIKTLIRKKKLNLKSYPTKIRIENCVLVIVAVAEVLEDEAVPHEIRNQTIIWNRLRKNP